MVWRKWPNFLTLWSFFKFVSEAAFLSGDLPFCLGGTIPPILGSGMGVSLPIAVKNGGD